jgi:hypothetical protein
MTDMNLLLIVSGSAIRAMVVYSADECVIKRAIFLFLLISPLEAESD